MSPPQPFLWALRSATRAGDIDAARRALEASADPNDRTGFITSLGLAAEYGQLEIAELLIAHGADVSWTNPEGWSAATFADAAEYHHVADRLVALGAPAHTRSAHGYTELHRAARRGNVGAAISAAQPSEIDRRDASGDTPLAHAIRCRHEVAVIALLHAGADPNDVNNDWSLLAQAAYQDSIRDHSTDFVTRLLDAGADANPPGYPVVFATVSQEGSNASVLRRLVAAGADIAAVTEWDGETILHSAAYMADAEHVATAIELGASLEARDHQGRTPLLHAAAAANEETLAYLLAHGANPDAKDSEGRGVDELRGK